ncbi:MAG: hypothetical protein IPK13_26550 [Deltaproteobacteria bacterium]|nr:hypothetical protein [Deltaproteobacteria bacterium]
MKVVMKCTRCVVTVIIALVLVLISIPVAAALFMGLRPAMFGVLAVAGLVLAFDPRWWRRAGSRP